MSPEENDAAAADDPDDEAWVDSADRTVVRRALAEHRDQARLSDVEHDRRHELVGAARTRGELRSLFDDLPPPHPILGAQVPTAPRLSGFATIMLSGGVIVVLAILAGWLAPALMFAGLLALVGVAGVVARRRG